MDSTRGTQRDDIEPRETGESSRDLNALNEEDGNAKESVATQPQTKTTTSKGHCLLDQERFIAEEIKASMGFLPRRPLGLAAKRRRGGISEINPSNGSGSVSQITTIKDQPSKDTIRGLRRNHKEETKRQKSNHQTETNNNHGEVKGAARDRKTHGLRQKGPTKTIEDHEIANANKDTADQNVAISEKILGQSQIGAVRVQGGHLDIEQQEGITDLDDHSSTRFDPEPDIGPIFSNQGLLVASQVEPSKYLIETEASPVDPAEFAHQQTKRQKERLYLLGFFLLGLAAITSVVLGTVLGIRNESASEVAFLPRPTYPPITVPAENNATADPSDLLILKDLPHYTLTSLIDPDSPQSRAYYYLSNIEDIEAMEEWRKRQLFALATLFYAFGGDRWQGALRNDWLGHRPECGWFSSGYMLATQGGIAMFDDPKKLPVCDEFGHFQLIDFENFWLNDAHMPPEVGFLTSLKEIRLPRNNITASLSSMLPQQLANLSNLTVINLGFNTIYGTIPSELGFLTNLEYFYLHSNKVISGTLVTELGRLTRLKRLDISKNALTGTFPAELSQLTNLEWLYANDNVFDGTVDSFGLNRLNNLQFLSLHTNELSGSLPPELSWTLPNLTQLDIHTNIMSGSLPTELAQMTSLRWLDVSSNSFTSTIPSEFALMTGLSVFDVSFNDLSGTIPRELGSTFDLDAPTTRISLLGNFLLSGSIPLEWCQFLTCVDRSDLIISFEVTEFNATTNTTTNTTYHDTVRRATLEVDCEIVNCECSCEKEKE